MSKNFKTGLIILLAAILVGTIFDLFKPKIVNSKKKTIVKIEEQELRFPIIKEPAKPLEKSITEDQRSSSELVEHLSLIQLERTDRIKNYKTDEIKKRLEWYKNINYRDYTSSKNKEHDKLSRKIFAQLKKVQKKEFPVLRKAFVNELRETVWEYDIYATISGSNSTILTMTSHVFASNGNIKSYFGEMSELLTSLKFKQARFKWYKDQSDYKYYNVESKPDDYLE